MLNQNPTALKNPTTKDSKAQAKLSQQKGMLAKLLAMENITVQHSKQSTAYFDTKNRVLILPIWEGISKELYNMFCGHEVGHALYTRLEEFGPLMDKLAQEFKNPQHDKPSIKTYQIVKRHVNVAEDARIEHLIQKRYPGLRRDFLQGYDDLWNRGFFGTKNVEDLQKYSFLDRVNCYFKLGITRSKIHFKGEEQRIVEQLSLARTLSELEEVVRLMLLRSKQEKKEKQQQQQNQGNNETDKSKEKSSSSENEESESEEDFSEDSSSENDFPEYSEPFDEDEESEEEESSGKNDEESEDENSEEKEESEGGSQSDSEDSEKKEENSSGNDEEDSDSANIDSEEKSEEDSEDEEKNASGQTSEGGGAGNNEKSLEDVFDENKDASTEKNLEKASESLASTSGHLYSYVYLAKLNSDKIVDDFPVVLFQAEKTFKDVAQSAKNRIERKLDAYIKSENQTISFMLKEFEMKRAAATFNRTRIARSGELDLNQLHNYKTHEDLFRRFKIVPNGKNHGFIMLLDGSSSMTTVFHDTVKQLLTLTIFCRRAQIPFDIYMFRSGMPQESDSLEQQIELNMNRSELRPTGIFKLRNLLSSRMSNSQFKFAALYLWAFSDHDVYSKYDQLSSTPLNSALIIMPEIIKNFVKRNMIQIFNLIVLTDGSSDGLTLSWNPSVSADFEKELIEINKNNPSPHRWDRKPVTHTIILHDEVLKKDFFFGAAGEKSDTSLTYYIDSNETQAILYDRIRDYVQTNIVGFYINKDIRYVNRDFTKVVEKTYDIATQKWSLTPEFLALKNIFEKDGYIRTNALNTDDFFCLNAKFMEIDDVPDLPQASFSEKSGKLKTNELARHFMKRMNKKVINRTLLVKYIDRISKFSE